MSVRKVSELPPVDVFDNTLRNNVMNSLLEISYSNNALEENAFWYTSKHFKYGDMVSSIIHEIVGSEDDHKTWHFWTTSYFHDDVYMYSGLNLSGNFYVNIDVPDEILNNYETIIRANRNILFGKTENILSAPTTNVYSDNINFWTYDGSTKIAYFGRDHIELNAPVTNLTVQNGLTAQDITCRNLQCNGTAVFVNDIQGTAMRARWADLAEGYEADQEYEPGTFVKFGGEKEITAADKTEANAVITTRPGFILGADDRPGKIQNIALVGRTPVKVVGPVKKFDRLVMSDIPGVATRLGEDSAGMVVARALADAPSELD